MTVQSTLPKKGSPPDEQCRAQREKMPKKVHSAKRKAELSTALEGQSEHSPGGQPQTAQDGQSEHSHRVAVRTQP